MNRLFSALRRRPEVILAVLSALAAAYVTIHKLLLDHGIVEAPAKASVEPTKVVQARPARKPRSLWFFTAKLALSELVAITFIIEFWYLMTR